MRPAGERRGDLGGHYAGLERVGVQADLDVGGKLVAHLADQMRLPVARIAGDEDDLGVLSGACQRGVHRRGDVQVGQGGVVMVLRHRGCGAIERADGL